MTAPPKPGERVVWRVTDHHDFDSLAAAGVFAREVDGTVKAVRILSPKPRLHGFEWALKQMKAGKRVKRLSQSYTLGFGKTAYGHITAASGTAVSVDGNDLLATDWQLAPTEAP
jgi:hypothetical protein